MAKKRDRRKSTAPRTGKASPEQVPAPGEVRARLGPAFFPALLLGLQLGLISAWNVYRGNQAEFDHGLLDLLPYLLPAFAAVTGIVWTIAGSMPGQAHRRSLSFLTMLGILLYVQGNLLIWDYGVFDGSAVDWARHQAKGWIELLLWVGALGAALARPRLLSRFARPVCLGLILLQCGALVVTSFSTGEGFWRREGSSADRPPEGIYRYSRGRNVIHLVMDAFQTDVFTELVDEENLGDTLEGFTLYGDNLGVAAHTSFAIPAIFSGEIYAGRESPSSYFGRAVNELGFTNQLYGEGYRVNLLPRLRMTQSSYHHHFRIPDTFGGASGFRRRQAVGQLLDVGLFRQLPHFAKRWLHNDGQWRLSGLISTPPAHRSHYQREFLREYMARIDPVLEEPSYNFIHIMTPHPPYGVEADGSPSVEPMPLTRESYKYEARQCLRVFVELLARLRDLDLYDDALIILQGDHGSNFPPVVDGKAVDLPTVRGPTLLAVKPPSATGPLVISAAQSSISDLPATVAEILGIENRYPGVPLSELAGVEDRARGFFHYISRDREIPVLRRFTVAGPVLDPDSWSEPATVEVVRDAADYRWGDFVNFGMEGNADPFLGPGWSSPLSNSLWSDGNRAHLYFQVPDPGEDVVFLLAMRPFLVPGKLDRQRVRILINDRELTTLELTDQLAHRYKWTVPGEFFRTDDIRLTFVLPDAAVPADLGAGGDRRKLGISVLTVCLFPESMTAEILERTAAPDPGDS